MQEQKQAKYIVCNKDCEHCAYDDCIKEKLYQREYQRDYREEHKEHIKQLQRDWNVRNYERRKALNKQKNIREKLKKLSTCSFCCGETGNTVMVYHKKVYCSDKCLMEYMLSKAKQKDIRVIDKGELDEQ